jgi:hypothetical protein
LFLISLLPCVATRVPLRAIVCTRMPTRMPTRMHLRAFAFHLRAHPPLVFHLCAYTLLKFPYLGSQCDPKGQDGRAQSAVTHF